MGFYFSIILSQFCTCMNSVGCFETLAFLLEKCMSIQILLNDSEFYRWIEDELSYIHHS